MEKALWQGQEASQSHYIHAQEAESEQEVGLGYQASRTVASDPLPPVRLHPKRINNLLKQGHQLGTKCSHM